MEIFKHKQFGKKYGYIFLLSSLLLMLALFPFLNQETLSQLVFNVLFSLIFIACLYTISTTKKEFCIGLAFVLPALITRWITFFSTDTTSIIINYIATFFFLSFIIYAIFLAILHEKTVSMNTVYGATCAYLLLGITWGVVFALIDYCIPSAFLGFEQGPFHQGYLDILTYRFENLLYYSFVTLTTLGYGDIIPVYPGAKFLSILEAVTGQLYIGTVIARLLGLYLSQKKISSK